jgi:hypothetical protein
VRTLLALALSALLLFVPAAHADEVPDLVQHFLDKMRDSCVKAGGKPEPRPEITSLDINGDGHPDWIAHYKNYCLDAPNQVCGDKDCVIEIFLGKPDGSVKFFLMQSTIAWRTDRILGRPAFIFTRLNEYCPQRKRRVCDERYIFERNGAFRHLPHR